MVTCPVPSLGSNFEVREGGHDLLIVIGEGIIIGVVVVLEGIPEEIGRASCRERVLMPV